MVNNLRKVDFSHPTGHYTWKKFRVPLEKILGALLVAFIIYAADMITNEYTMISLRYFKYELDDKSSCGRGNGF